MDNLNHPGLDRQRSAEREYRDYVQPRVAEHNAKVQSFLDAKKRQNKLVKALFFYVFCMLLGFAVVAFVVLSAINVALYLGDQYVTSTEIAPVYAEPWVFLAVFAGMLVFCACLGMNNAEADSSNLALNFGYYFGAAVTGFWKLPAISRETAKNAAEMKRLKNQMSTVRSELYYCALVAGFIAIFLILKFAFGQWKVFSGWGIEVETMFFVIALVLIDRFRYVLMFGILAPLLALPLSSGLLYPLQVIFEYLLAYWVLFPICAFYHADKAVSERMSGRQKPKSAINAARVSHFFAWILVLYLVKAFIHVVAGVIWWTNYDWTYSIVLNAEVILGSFGLCLPFGLAAIVPVIKLRDVHLRKEIQMIKV